MSKRSKNTEAAAPDRDAMIAVAAYFRAEQRGFTPGDSVDDWLQAAAEIDRMLAPAALPVEAPAAPAAKAKAKAKTTAAPAKPAAKAKSKTAAAAATPVKTRR